MLFLDPKKKQVVLARREFELEVQDFIFERIELHANAKKYDRYTLYLFDSLIIPNLELLISGNPFELSILDTKIYPFVLGEKKFKELLKQVFDYDFFISKKHKSYNGYNLAQKLNIRTCTHCNRNYTDTIITKDNKRISRPQFDHFFDKGKRPHFALSFYNLIPSCQTCNGSVKHAKGFSLKTHIHPYCHNKTEKFKFTYKYDLNSNNGLKIKLKIGTDRRLKKTLEDLAIEDVYNSQTDILYDLLKIKQSFSDRYLDILADSLLKDITISKDELYRLAFGTELHKRDFVNRPLSKFKYDILQELGIIKK